jgi:secreted trypsin-like serine protease
MVSTTLFIGANTLESATEQYQLSMSTPELKIIVYPGYIESQRLNDIAMVKLPTKIGFFNHAVNIVYLPNNSNIISTNIPALVMGYGQDTWFTAVTNRLLMANTQTIPNAGCNPSYITVQDTQMCSDNADSGVCVGDEGGPLVIVRNGRYVQIGIIQVISDTTLLGSCRTGVKVFTRVSSYLDWIKSNM